MSGYLLRRVLLVIPMLLGITVIAFTFMNLAPGDPVTAMIDPQQGSSVNIGELRERYGLNQPIPVLEQVLTGRYADGLGNVKDVPQRIDFDPFPWASMAVWMLTQMRRWGYLKQDVDYKAVAEKIFLVTDARKRMAEMDLAAPKESYKSFKVMGREFDANSAAAYAKSFKINRLA